MRPSMFVCFLFLVSSTVAFAGARGKALSIETTSLGRPAGYYEFIPTAINNKGEVVGVGRRLDDEFGYREDAFFWSLQNGFILIASDAIAQDINERGDVAVANWSCYPDESRCYYFGGSIWNRGTEVMNLVGMYPLALNNRGDVAGHCPGPFNGGPIVWDGPACAIRRGVFEEWSCQGDEPYEYCGQVATGINERGDIVGQRFTNFAISPGPQGQSWAVIFPRQGGTVVLEAGTSASGINNRGTIVGHQFTGTAPAAVAWTQYGLERLLGSLPSAAAAINSRGWILGANIVWTSQTELPLALGGAAIDINDRGQIVGVIGTFPSEAVIWTVKR